MANRRALGLEEFGFGTYQALGLEEFGSEAANHQALGLEEPDSGESENDCGDEYVKTERIAAAARGFAVPVFVALVLVVLEVVVVGLAVLAVVGLVGVELVAPLLPYRKLHRPKED
jgi:hypothetical protein